MCKHLKGILIEYMVATHERIVEDGEMDNIGYNDIGEITGYKYICHSCRKSWKYSSRPKQKWLLKIHNQLSDVDE